jgi:branched-chain amino acid transport system ATP-binding protein
MLSLRNIVVHYGGVEAVKGISLEVAEQAITGLIGGNGAGKSTTLRAISGLVPLSKGEIWFEGRRIDGLAPEKIFELGIVHVPEGRKLFLEMSILDNLLAGAYLRRDLDRLGKDLDRIFEYFPVLGKARHRPASNLSGGEQQMLAIARGLMADPKLLMLDEPSLGLSPLLTKEVGRIIGRIASEGVPILLVEQNASLAFQLSQKIYVMETGSITLAGDPKDLQDNPYVKEAYLGLCVVEAPSFAPSPAEKPMAVAAARSTERRWQDRGPQERWQDRTPEGGGTKPRPRELPGRIEEFRREGVSTTAAPQSKTPGEQAGERVGRTRWLEEAAEPAGSPASPDFPDRWLLKVPPRPEKETGTEPIFERRTYESLPKEQPLEERWPQEWRPKSLEGPARLVKKRIVPQITGLKKERQ